MKRGIFLAILGVLLLVAPDPALSEDKAAKCDIQRGPCTARTSDGVTVVFDIQPKPVVAMAELKFFVTIGLPGKSTASVSSLALDLSMPGMHMGPNQPVLKRTGSGRYEGTGIIPRCVTGKKTWKAAIIMRLPDRVSIAAFLFEVN